jgi:crossover junction endodeoxyribonuclease RuvC
MLYIGIDPGLTGAIAFYDSGLHDLVALHKMPVDRVEVNEKNRGRINEHYLLDYFRGLAGALAVIERPEIRPLKTRNKQDGTLTARKPGAAGMFAFGEGYGIVRMGLIACGIRLVEIRPNAWKARMRVRGGKDESRRIAAETFPAWAQNFKNKNSDGPAEAALMAVWGHREYPSGSER